MRQLIGHLKLVNKRGYVCLRLHSSVFRAYLDKISIKLSRRMVGLLILHFMLHKPYCAIDNLTAIPWVRQYTGQLCNNGIKCITWWNIKVTGQNQVQNKTIYYVKYQVFHSKIFPLSNLQNGANHRVLSISKSGQAESYFTIINSLLNIQMRRTLQNRA